MKRYAKVVLWLLVFCAGLFVMDRVMRRDDGKERYNLFFEDQAGFDVFLLGNSHVLDGVYPIEMWRDHGIVSFNFGNTGEPLCNTYWTLRLLLPYGKPKVALIDVSYIDRIKTSYTFAHEFMDQLPLSAEKIRAVYALFPEGRRQEFLFPLSLYHTRWEEFIDGVPDRYMTVYPCMFGAELRTGRHEPDAFTRTTKMAEEPSACEPWLRDIIELCRAEGVEPVLMVVPFPAAESMQEHINRVQLVADEYGVSFLNLFDVPGLVDFDTDCYDPASHLNPDGATKVTRYVGQWLSDHCDLPDRRSDPRYAHWHDALETYTQLRRDVWSGQSLIDHLE